MTAAYIERVFNTEQAWLDWRKQKITASDAAPIMGVSPRDSAFSLMQKKRGLIDDTPDIDPELLYWGTALEEAIAQRYAKLTGNFVVPRDYRCEYVGQENVDRPWQACTVDRFLVDPSKGRGVLEIKTAQSFLAWNWGKSESALTDDEKEQHGDEDTRVPLYVQLQVQHQLAVTGLSWASVAVLIGGCKFRYYDLDRDDEMIAILNDTERRWWDCWQDGEEWPVDGSESTTRAVKRVYQPKRKESVFLPPQSCETWQRRQELAEQRERLKRELKPVEEDLAELDNQVRLWVGENQVGLGAGFKVTRTMVKRKEYVCPASEYERMTWKKLKED